MRLHNPDLGVQGGSVSKCLKELYSEREGRGCPKENEVSQQLIDKERAPVMF